MKHRGSQVARAKAAMFPRCKPNPSLGATGWTVESGRACTQVGCSAKTVGCTRAKCFAARGYTEIPDSRHHLSSTQLSTSGADERHR